MANINTTRKITIVAATEGVMYSKEQLDALKGSMVGVAKASEAMAAATVTETKTRLSAVTPLEKLERQFFQTVRAQQDFAKVTKVTSDALAQGTIAFEKINAVQLAGAQRFNQATQAGDKQNDAVISWKQNLIRLREQYDPLFAAGNRYKESLAGISLNQQVGAMTAKQAAAAVQDTKVAFVQQVNALRGVRDAHDEASKAALQGANANRFAAHEVINLSRQVQDIGVGIFSGQGLLTVAIQQGTQILDVVANSTGSIGGLISQVGEWAGRVFTPLRLAAGGIIAFGASIVFAASQFNSSQKEIERALMGIGRQSGVTVGDINRIAESASSATGLSIGEAREAATEFARTGKIYKDNVEAATATTRNFALVTGQDTSDAAKMLAKALSGDLVQGFESLNSVLGNMSGKQREAVRDLQIQNKTQEAQAIIIKATADATKNAADLLGPFAKAWEAVYNSAAKYYDLVGKGAARLTGTNPLQDQMNALVARQSQLGPAISAAGTGQFSKRSDVANMKKEFEENIKLIDALIPKLQELAAERAKVRDADSGRQADDAVRALIPQIEQIEKLKTALEDLKRAKEDANVSGNQGLSAQNDAAIRAAQVQLSLIKDSMAESDRHNQKVLEIGQSYRNVSLSTALVLNNQKDQLMVARAVGGAQQIVAQQIATQNQLMLAGKSVQEAMLIAAGQRAIAEAQVNSSIKEQIISLDQQTDLIKAQLTGTEDKVRAEQAYDNAIRAGASTGVADAIADATERNGKAQKEVAAETQRLKAKDQERLAILKQQNEAASEYHRWVESIYDGTNRLINAMNFAGSSGRTSESGAGGSGLGFEGSKTSAGGFNDLTWKQLMQQGFGEGKRQISDFENVGFGGLIQIKPDVLAQEARAALDKLINPLEMQRVEAQIAGDKPGEINAVQAELDIYKRQPRTLENLNAIKSLTETLKSLNESTDTLTDSVDAMNITLDPIYSQGREALKIGYYDQGSGSSKGYVTGSPTAVSQPQIQSPSIVPQQQPVNNLPVGPGVFQGWGPGVQRPVNNLPVGPNGWTPGITQPQQPSMFAKLPNEQELALGKAAYEEWRRRHPEGIDYALHAATGYSGVVGGSGGTDSQLFQAMVTPGEHVQITPPGQPRTPSWQDRQIRETNDNAPKTIINNNNKYLSFNFNVGGGDRSDLSSRATRRQIRESYGRETAAVA